MKLFLNFLPNTYIYNIRVENDFILYDPRKNFFNVSYVNKLCQWMVKLIVQPYSNQQYQFYTKTDNHEYTKSKYNFQSASQASVTSLTLEPSR